MTAFVIDASIAGLYLALAIENDRRFITADERFVRKIGRGPYRSRVISLIDAAADR